MQPPASNGRDAFDPARRAGPAIQTASGARAANVANIARARPRPLMRRPLVLAFLLTLSAATFIVALDRGGTGPASGTALFPPGASGQRPGEGAARTTVRVSPGRLRVGTFNIHGGRGPDRVRDLERTATCLAGLSFAGLNEVHDGPLSPCQAQVLGDALGMSWLFAPTERQYYREGFGNGVLSRLPVRSWRREPLVNTRGKAFRNLVLVECAWDQRTLWLLVTHLDRHEDRLPQLAVVAERFLDLPTPAILMGDLNSRGDEPALAKLLATADVHDLVTEGYEARKAHSRSETMESERPADPSQRIDWIVGRGVRATGAGMVERGASDHPAYWVEVEEAHSATAALAEESPEKPATNHRR